MRRLSDQLLRRGRSTKEILERKLKSKSKPKPNEVIEHRLFLDAVLTPSANAFGKGAAMGDGATGWVLTDQNGGSGRFDLVLRVVGTHDSAVVDEMTRRYVAFHRAFSANRRIDRARQDGKLLLVVPPVAENAVVERGQSQFVARKVVTIVCVGEFLGVMLERPESQHE